MKEPLSILVVDDNQSMAKSLRDVLELKGFIAYEASSGAEALEILHDHPMDVMVTDVIMPEMDGVALYQEARKTHPKLTTFLMTAYAANDLIQKGMLVGIKTVLPKPLDIDFLLLLLSGVENHAKKAG
jgi:two-component system response regulator YesN